MATQFTEGRFRGESASGAPLSGGRLYTYAVGTTTWQTTYTDYTLTTQNTYINDGAGGKYIALDSRGECSVWLGAGLTYSFKLTDSTGATIWTDDGIKAKADAATTADTATTATTATKATNLANGGAGRVPYQSAADTTGFTAAGTSGQYLTSGGTGVPTWTTPPTITSGTYTPTLVNTAFVTSSSASGWFYQQVGNIVYVAGSLTTTATAASYVTATVPVLPASNWGSTGPTGSGSGSGASTGILPEPTSKLARILVNATASTTVYLFFMYSLV